MQFQATALDGVHVIHLEPIRDSRGSFARTFCVEEFSARGLETHYPQHSVSFSTRKGTLRGMHYQRPPYSEVKLIRCLSGAIWDVLIDIRPGSPTYGRWQSFELSNANGCQLYVPKGLAHGFQTLSDDVQVGYLISEPHVPHAAYGIRYNDPRFAITWPFPISEISMKDLQWPDFVGDSPKIRQG